MKKLHLLFAVIGVSMGGSALATLDNPMELSSSSSESSLLPESPQDVYNNIPGSVVPLSVAHDYHIESQKIPNPHFYSMSKHENDTASSHFPAHILSAPLTGCASLDFSAAVMLGNQGPFELIVDTGSSSLGVAGSQCATCTAAGLTPLYTPNPQATASMANGVSALFGDGSGWKATAYTENVGVGEATATGVIIASMTSQNKFFSTTSCDFLNKPNTHQGIIGYAYPVLAIRPTTTFFSTWQRQTQSPNVFTIQMCRRSGTLWHGQVDPNSYTGSLLWTPIIEQLFYVVHVNDIGLETAAGANNFRTLGVTAAQYQAGRSIFDSGTTQFLLPTTAFNTLQTLLNNNNAFVAAFGTNFLTGGFCLTPRTGATLTQLNAALPKLQIILGDANGNNPLAMQLNAVSSYLLLVKDQQNNILYCPGVGASPAGSSITIFGWSVMNQYVVVHDVANSMIGLAPSKCAATDASGTSSPPGILKGTGVPNPNFVANAPGVTNKPGTTTAATTTKPPATTTKPPVTTTKPATTTKPGTATTKPATTTTPANPAATLTIRLIVPTALANSKTALNQFATDFKTALADILGVTANAISLSMTVTPLPNSQTLSYLYIVMKIDVPQAAAAETMALVYQSTLDAQIMNPMSMLSTTTSAALSDNGIMSVGEVIDTGFGAQMEDVAPDTPPTTTPTTIPTPSPTLANGAAAGAAGINTYIYMMIVGVIAFYIQ